MKTIFINQKDIKQKWYLIDAEGKTLGRLAVSIAIILRGKNKAYFSPHQPVGDAVIVVNSEKVVLTGQKTSKKMYYRHSGYPSGLTQESFDKIIKRKPEYPLEHAVKGMLPKNRLGRKLFNNLKVYAGPEHPHAAQKPEKIEV